MLPLSPSKLGRYEIVDEIGKGAMGVVYLARDPLIGRLVALKTFRIGYSIKDAELEQFRARFIREAQSAGILSHPNIVTIHDVVERGEEGMAFIAMEYVRGTNLKSVLQEPQRPTMPYICEILGQIADGLDYAHSCKVIHRDIKPANILITTDNRAKITDFGIARLDTSNLTQEGQLLGTPNYMSPEQILGRDVDHRADIFSLGVVLYEMVTRHKPFQGENLTVVSHRIVYDHFTPPREYADDLPPGAEQVLAKALEKDPARRYQRARDMADDLRRVLGSAGKRDQLNETQSLSATAVLPAHLVRAGIAGVTADQAGGGAAPAALAVLPPAARTDPAALSDTPGTSDLAASGPVLVGEAAGTGPRTSLWRRLTGRSGSGRAAVGGGAGAGGVAPAGVAPAGVAPGGAAPAGVAPAGVAPAGVAPGGAAPGGAIPGEAPAGGQMPSGAGPGGVGPGGVGPGGVGPGGQLPGGLVQGGLLPSGASGPSPPAVAPGGLAAASGLDHGEAPSAEAPSATAVPSPPLAFPATMALAGTAALATVVLPHRAEVPAGVGAPWNADGSGAAPAADAPPGGGPAAGGPAASPHGARPTAVPSEIRAAGADPAIHPSLPSPLPAPRAPGAAVTPRQVAVRGRLLAWPSPARLAVAVAVGAILSLLLAALPWLWMRAPTSARPARAALRFDAAQPARAQFLALLRDGRRRLDAGDPDGAAAAFRAAEQLVPGHRGARQLREEAERRQLDARQRSDQEKAIESKLEEGRLSLTGRHYDEAEAAAQAVLAMSPGNTVAEGILTSVKEGRARRRDRATSASAQAAARAVETASPALRPDAAARGLPAAPPAAPEIKDATLELGFFSKQPEGSLLIYVNGRKVLQEPFRFYEKAGLFRSRPTTGWVRRSFHLPAGNAEIRLYVTPRGSAAVVRTLAGPFAGGGTRRLDVQLDDDGQVTAQLN
jgi:tRNA A-37 threonylcarbamoyl transferase component Bud32